MKTLSRRHTLRFAALFCLAAATSWAAAQDAGVLRMATTTSTESSGLLKFLLPRFEAKSGLKVQVISVGTGKAIKLGEDGNVDVLLVHARAAEDKYMAEGHGTVRRDVMYNDFIIVGPTADPARLRGRKDVIDAMKALQAAGTSQGTRFISRGDDSGTDQMEKGYWKTAGFDAVSGFKGQPWYASAGVGMGEVLTMAGQMQGYTLTDRATYGAYKDRTGLDILVQGDVRMFNPYGVMDVNPKKSPAINQRAALAFIDWITSAEGQQTVADFKVNGEQLFFPNTTK
jgi:tungstate transport system substrate-binding protein